MIQWLRNLGHSLGGLVTLITDLWGKARDVKDHTLSLFSDVRTLIDNVGTVVTDIQNFQINPKWNSRVIVVPRVVEKITELYAVPQRIITDVRDLVQLLKNKIEPAEVNTEDIDALDRLPEKFVHVGTKILGWATLIVDSLLAIESALADLNDIVDALRTTLEDLNNLDALFLPQGNPKSVVDKHYRKRQRS